MDRGLLIDLSPENVSAHGLFCSKNHHSFGFQQKSSWFAERYHEGMRIKLLEDRDHKALGFIEYLPADAAWRPVHAPGYMFVHCIMVYPPKNKNKGHGTRLLKSCEQDAEARAMAGVCAMTSPKPWMAEKDLFLKNQYAVAEGRGRFELVYKTWDPNAGLPRLLDWEARLKNYQGWHLVYADQCPYHEKAVQMIAKTAREYGLEVQVHKLTSSAEAKEAPSGFGVFSLVHDGRLIEDHYISQTRFRSIIRKEMNIRP